MDNFIHEQANVFDSARLGKSIKVGAFAEVGNKVIIGDGVNISCGVFIPENVIIEEDVFIGPHTVFTNDKYPPSKGKWRSDPPTIVRKGAKIGANCTILPGVVIGEGSAVGAGSVVTKDVPDGFIVAGNPARVIKPVYTHED